MELSKCLGCMEDFRGYPCPSCGYDPGKDKHMEYALPLQTILYGKYLVGKVLGQGGFGITYIGWDIALERKVAIKEYYPSGQVSRSPGTRNLTWYTTEAAEQAHRDGIQMFLKEARKMSKVDGIPGVVRVLDLFQENGTAYIVMEFIEGVTLKAKLQQTGPLPWEQVRELFLSVIQTMAQVHKAGLVHRDLSPDNIMLLPDGSVKILDLGAAKDLSINSGASSMQVAKSGFSPLEQYTQRGGSGPWTDVYSMAATIYYTLTGKLPPNAIDRLDKDTLSWENAALLALPPQTLKALQKAMAVQAQNRTQSMDVLGQGLMGKKQSPQPQTVPGGQNSGKKPDNSAAEGNQTGEKAKKKRKWIVPVAAACVVACLAVTPLLLRKSTSSPSQSGTAQTTRNTPVKSGVSPTGSNFNADSAYLAQLNAWTEHVSQLPDVGTMRTYWDEQNRERCRIYEDLQGKRMYAITAEYDGDGNIIEERCYDENGDLQIAQSFTWQEKGRLLAWKDTDGSGKCLQEMTSTLDSSNRITGSVLKNGAGKTIRTTSVEYGKDGSYTSTTVNADGVTVTSNQYDADGKLLSFSFYRADGTYDGKVEYVYQKDLKVKTLQYNAAGGVEFETRYTYKEDRVIQEEFYRNGLKNDTAEYTYNSYNELLSIVHEGDCEEIVLKTIRDQYLRSYRFDRNGSEYSCEYVSDYDWQGRQTEQKGYDKDGTPSYSTVCSYDEEGNQTGSVSTHYSDYDGSRSVTEYDADSNPVSNKTYSKDGNVESWTEYEYDKARHTRTDYRYSGDGKLEYQEVHQYDDQNNELWSERYDGDGKLIGRTAHQYDDQSNELWSKSYDENGKLRWEDTYTYDSLGILTGHTSTYYSSRDNSKTVTEYDGNYNQISKKEYDANGNLISSN